MYTLKGKATFSKHAISRESQTPDFVCKFKFPKRYQKWSPILAFLQLSPLGEGFSPSFEQT